ncbi:MAG: hypothetical protein ABH986_05230 [archaeon]
MPKKIWKKPRTEAFKKRGIRSARRTARNLFVLDRVSSSKVETALRKSVYFKAEKEGLVTAFVEGLIKNEESLLKKEPRLNNRLEETAGTATKVIEASQIYGPKSPETKTAFKEMRAALTREFVAVDSVLTEGNTLSGKERRILELLKISNQKLSKKIENKIKAIQ